MSKVSGGGDATAVNVAGSADKLSHEADFGGILMATIVSLDVFSGRDNPTWVLTDDEAHELNGRLASLRDMTHQRPTGVFGGLGYRGFTIGSDHHAFAASANLRVHEGVVDRGLSSPNLVDNAEIERFLLKTAPTTLPIEVTQHVGAQIAFPQNFSLAASMGGCPPCHASDAPAYNPGAWNTPAVQPNNNCYNYANDHATNTFAQPGRAHGITLTALDCAHVQPAAVADGLSAATGFGSPLAAGKGWYVALVIWPGSDYHWYRQDNTGCWSHKPGRTTVRDVDNAGHPISDPKTCNRGPYTVFCIYMVTHRGVVIA